MRTGTVLNINADVAAGAIASELRAAKLIYISDVRGIMRDPAQADSLIPSVNSEQIAKLIKDEIIEGGMIPKVESAVESLGERGGKVHLIDGRVAHSLLLEVFSNSGTGRRFCLEGEGCQALGRWLTKGITLVTFPFYALHRIHLLAGRRPMAWPSRRLSRLPDAG